METTSSSSSWPSVVGAVIPLCVFGPRVPRRTRASASLRVRFVNLLWIVVLAHPALCLGDDKATERVRPNVLFISIDDLNDWVGFLGGHPQAKTPNMDRLAARGVVFSNAHAAAPLCCPSRAAVYSGKQPFNTGVYNNSHDIRRVAPRWTLLPRYFKKHGYRTFGTGKLLHRKRTDLFDDEYFPHQRWSPFQRDEVTYTRRELRSKGSQKPRHVVRATKEHPEVVLPRNGMPSDRSPRDSKGESFDWGPIDVEDGVMGDAKIVDWSVKRLEQGHKAPFFLAVGFYRPHTPLFAPRKYFEMHPVAATELPDVLEGDLDDLNAVGKRWAREAVTAGLHETVLKHKEWKAAVTGYLACVSFVDAQVGRLLDALDRGPHSDTTIVMLWSDHGWHLGEKEHWGKWTGWERSTRVPLAIVPTKNSRDGFRIGSVCRQPVSLVDLYPTLIDLCGLKPKRDLDGASLVPRLHNPDAISYQAAITTFDRGNYSIRTRRWRLIRYRDGSEELYDHKSDSHEWRNVIGEKEHAEVKAGLRAWVPARRRR